VSGGFDAGAYGAAVEEIFSEAGRGERLMPLVAEAGSIPPPPALEHARAEVLFPAARAPQAALAGLLLYFDRSDEAHAIAQDLETPEGSFWHGILHRREPDASNAAYWFRRTGQHPVYPALAQKAREVLQRIPEAQFVCEGSWDPFAFIDFCESVREGAPSRSQHAAMEIQRAEWQLLFDFCARAVR